MDDPNAVTRVILLFFVFLHPSTLSSRGLLPPDSHPSCPSRGSRVRVVWRQARTSRPGAQATVTPQLTSAMAGTLTTQVLYPKTDLHAAQLHTLSFIHVPHKFWIPTCCESSRFDLSLSLPRCYSSSAAERGEGKPATWGGESGVCRSFVHRVHSLISICHGSLLAFYGYNDILHTPTPHAIYPPPAPTSIRWPAKTTTLA